MNACDVYGEGNLSCYVRRGVSRLHVGPEGVIWWNAWTDKNISTLNDIVENSKNSEMVNEFSYFPSPSILKKIV